MSEKAAAEQQAALLRKIFLEQRQMEADKKARLKQIKIEEENKRKEEERERAAKIREQQSIEQA